MDCRARARGPATSVSRRRGSDVRVPANGVRIGMTMKNGDDVLLVTPQVMVASAVESALSSNGRAWTLATVRSVREMLVHLGGAGTRAVLVDLDANPQQTLAELERISIRYPSTRFIALATTLDQDLLLSAMQSGVRHVLLKNQIAQQLITLLQRLGGPGPAAAAAEGDLYVVLSAGGGCGASTLAVNLADELSTRSGKPALLIDLDRSYSALAILLGVDCKYGLDHVLTHSAAIDAHLISSTAVPHTEKMHLLGAAAGDGFAPPERLELDRLGQVVDAAVQAYAHVVVDAPRVPADVAAMLASASARTLVAMQLTVKDTRIARSMLAALSQHGVARETIIPLVTRYAKRQHAVSLEDAMRALGGGKLECVRNDYPSVSRAMDFGQTLAVAAPRSLARRDVQDLVSRIAATAAARK